MLNTGNPFDCIYQTVHCSRLHHTCSFSVWFCGSHFSLFQLWVKYFTLSWWQHKLLLTGVHFGYVELQNEQQKVWCCFVTKRLTIKCCIHTLQSHKMALALCGQLAHLSVLKLCSENYTEEEQEEFTDRKACTPLSYWPDFHLATSQPMIIQRFFHCPPHFWPHLKRKKPFTSEFGD